MSMVFLSLFSRQRAEFARKIVPLQLKTIENMKAISTTKAPAAIGRQDLAERGIGRD